MASVFGKGTQRGHEDAQLLLEIHYGGFPTWSFPQWCFPRHPLGDLSLLPRRPARTLSVPIVDATQRQNLVLRRGDRDRRHNTSQLRHNIAQTVPRIHGTRIVFPHHPTVLRVDHTRVGQRHVLPHRPGRVVVLPHRAPTGNHPTRPTRPAHPHRLIHRVL